MIYWAGDTDNLEQNWATDHGLFVYIHTIISEIILENTWNDVPR